MNRHDPPPGVDAPVFAEQVFAEQVFAEPWQAEAFALAVALHEKGLFSWSEWAEALST